MKPVRSLTGMMALIVCLSGCATWSAQPVPPEVLLVNLEPLDSTLFEQRLRVILRIRNPNERDLQLTGMDFLLDVNGKRLARGLSSDQATVPRLGDTLVTVTTSTSTLDVMRQLLALTERQEVAYEIKGVLHTDQGKLSFHQADKLVEQGRIFGPAGAGSASERDLTPAP